jgi:signal transduction histidine kinase/HAMP domain-containing protein
MDCSKKIYVRDALSTGDVVKTDIYFSMNLNSPTMTFAIPLASQGLKQSFFGVLVARINLERSIYSLLLDRTGLGKTGEAVILSREYLVLNRLHGHAGFPLTVKLRDDVSQEALAGKTGAGESRDYRGKRVLAAYRFLPRVQWALVIKKDADEVYASYHAFMAFIAAVSLSGLVIAYGAARSQGRGQARQVRALIRAAARIKDGDHSFRAAAYGDDEFGDLVSSFNALADSLIARLNVQKQSSDIIHVMVSTLSLEEFSRNVLRTFVEVTESSLGAFYVLSPDGSEFKHLTSIGLDVNSLENFHAGSLEGEFGKALATREIALTKNISEKSMVRLRTIVGDIVPREIMTIPVIVSNRTAAIVSLATLGQYADGVMNVLNQVRPVLNTAFSNILSDEETRRLAKELSEKNQLLESQKRALVTQAEELRRQSEKVRKQNIELESQRQKVEEANKLKSEFLSNMSHELRTPLNSIVALSHVLLLQAGDRLNADEIEYLEIIDRNSGKLLTLINDILDLSKIEAGRIDLKIKPLALASMVRMILDNLEQLAEDKGIGLKLIVEGEIPPVESDESRVYQILQNIIGNAVKFTEKGGVTITMSARGPAVSVMIEDTGIGIAADDLPRIFEEFRQIDGTLSRKYDGTGLGLAIASKSARLISAAIHVSSEPGQGSRFEIIIPRQWRSPSVSAMDKTVLVRVMPEYAPELAASFEGDHFLHSGPASRQRAGGRKRPRVLVVDDDSDNILAVRAVLRDEYSIFEAHDGDGAMEAVWRENPDLILLDMALPGKSGFSERILEAGCDDYVPKPFDVTQLCETIRRWLDRT